MKQKCGYIFFFIVISLSVIGVFPLKIFAQSYGGGSFGSGNYNANSNANSSNANHSDNSTTSTPSCSQMPPLNQPQWLYAAIPQNATTIKLYFTDASGPYDHYVVQYGLRSGNYIYSLLNAGGKGTRIVTINALMPRTKYYFQVRAGNGCAVGPWSNIISVTTTAVIAKNTLRIATTRVIPSKNPQTATKKGKGYTINVGIKNTQNMPIVGARVTLHSTPQTALTDENGIAHFEDIDGGQHQVLIAYNNYNGEGSITLTGNTKIINVTMNVEPQPFNMSPLLIGIFSGLVIVVGGLGGVVVYVFKKNQKK